MNSKQLWNKRAELVDKMTAAAAADDMAEAHRVEGEIRALDDRLAEALDREEEARNAPATNMIEDNAHAAHDGKATPSAFAEALFGPRDEFDGLRTGFRASAPVRDAVSGLSTPQIYKYDLEGPAAPPTGFLATLPHGTTDGDEHFFLTPVLTNNAAGWVSGNKAESALEWTPAVAHLETIAHHMPIQKQTARRYNQLESIVGGSLMLGLDLKCDAMALRADSETGMVGVTETDGILEHTKAAGANIKDTLQTMARKVRVATGIAPTHVALSPYAIEALSQAKDEIGRYLFPDIGNGSKIAGLTIVEDVNMTFTYEDETSHEDVTKETALVYAPIGASFDIADPEEVTVGLIDKQLIQNAYTILAELTATLKVTIPAAFCYCADLGLEAE